MPKVRTVPLAEKGLSQSEKYAIIRYSHMSETEQAQNELQARLGGTAVSPTLTLLSSCSELGKTPLSHAAPSKRY